MSQVPDRLTLEQSARRVGHYAWIEMRLFEALGGWSVTVPELEVKTMLGRHGHHHAWHAELFTKRLPELAGMGPRHLVTAANAEMVAFVTAMTTPEAPDLTIEKLVGVYRVLLPRTISAYSQHLAATSPISDAPTTRWLGFVLQDETTHWREGEVALQSLIHNDDEVIRAGRRQAELETIITRAGGITGHQ